MSEKSIRRNEDQYCCYRKLENNGIRVIWEITGRCNLNCRHCFVNKDSMYDKDIDKMLAKKICKELCDSKVDKVMITGGEPLLYDHFSDVIRYLKKNSSMVIDITTNGLLLTKEMISLFHEIGIDELSISLDGPAEVYEMIRGVDGVDKVLQNVQNLSKFGIKVDAIMTVNRLNINYIKETIKLAYANGFASITISNLLKLYDSSFDYNQLCLPLKEIAQMKELFLEQRKIYEQKFPIRSVGFSILQEENINHRKCNHPNLYAINRDGCMLKCLNAYSEKIAYVNLREHTVSEAMSIIDQKPTVDCFMV